MEDLGDALNGRDASEPEQPEAGLDMAQSILSKFSMKSLFGFKSKLESVKPEEEDAVLKAFRSVVADSMPLLVEPSSGQDPPETEARVPPDFEHDGKAAGVEKELEGRQRGAEAGIPLAGQVPLDSVSVSGDNVVLVRGTLVNTTSDSDSDDGGQEPEEGSNTNGPEPLILFYLSHLRSPRKRQEMVGEMLPLEKLVPLVMETSVEKSLKGLPWR